MRQRIERAGEGMTRLNKRVMPYSKEDGTMLSEERTLKRRIFLRRQAKASLQKEINELRYRLSVLREKRRRQGQRGRKEHLSKSEIEVRENSLEK